MGAINLYTMETRLYGTLNRLLRESTSRDSPEFRSEYFPYMRILMEALRAMAKKDRKFKMVNRGVQLDLSSMYKDKFVAGSEFVWWAFSSCTSEIATLNNPMF